MPARILLRLAELLVPILLAIVIFTVWQADRRDRAQLATQLAAAQQAIAEAASRQKDRDAALNQTLTQIADLKQSVVTPAQILKALPQALNLPQPITLQPNPPSTTPPVGARFSAFPSDARTAPSALATNVSPEHSSESNLPNNPFAKPSASASNAVIPSADLKPLYDFALDCQACQAKLAATQSDLADEKTKTAALTKERDEALKTAKGGSALRRIARAAKWFALGAAAGAIAAKTVH